MYQRLPENRVKEALANSPVVLLAGPKRAGKTTLAQKVCEGDYRYVTLDDEMDFNWATEDPAGYIRDFDKVIIDEIQRVPELFRTIKKSVDENPRPGRFLLTGSANPLLMPRMGDSLVGRMQLVNLLPLAQAEIMGVEPTFLDRLFKGKFENSKSEVIGDDLIQLVIEGGYPENVGKNQRQRMHWTKSYLNFVLTRNLREIAIIEKLTCLPRLVESLAAYSGQLANFSRLGSDSGLNYHTVQRYIALLEQIYLVSIANPWHTNSIKRVSKTPKLHFIGSSLLLSASNIGFEYLKRDRGKFGHFLECFVYSEILKLIPASDLWLTPYHFRDNCNREVDMVLERDDGLIAGIKVKSSATVKPSDFRGLRALSEICGERFVHGVVLYDGTRYMPCGERLSAVPLSSMWE